MRSYWHLSEDERDQIGVLRAAGRSMGAIARALGRAKATISRELQRNALPSGGYSPLHAAGAYQLRRRREAILEREAAYACSWGIGSPKDGRPNRSPVG
jgi:transposase, IS30 family